MKFNIGEVIFQL